MVSFILPLINSMIVNTLMHIYYEEQQLNDDDFTDLVIADKELLAKAT